MVEGVRPDPLNGGELFYCTLMPRTGQSQPIKRSVSFLYFLERLNI